MKNKITYVLILFLAGVFSILYNEYYTAVFFIGLLCLPLILFLLLVITYSKLSVKLETLTPVLERGDSLLITINLKNSSIFPIARIAVTLTYSNQFSDLSYKKILAASIDRNSSQTITCKFQPNYSGVIEFKVKSISLLDYFSIWKLKKRSKETLRVTVTPKIYEVEEDFIIPGIQLPSNEDHYSKYKSGDDPSEVFDIREYREGDRPHRIHWKLSYKQNELMIKEFSESEHSKIVVVIESFCDETRKSSGRKHANSLVYVDKLLECALSVSYSLILNEHEHSVVWYDGEKMDCSEYPVMEIEDLFLVMEGLLNTKLSQVNPISLSTYEKGHQKEPITHLIYFTTVLNSDDILKWLDHTGGTIIYLFYLHETEQEQITEEARVILEERQILFYSIQINETEDILKNNLAPIQI